MYIVGIDSMDVLVLAAENQKVSDKNKRLKGDLQTLSGAYNETYQKSRRKMRDSEVRSTFLSTLMLTSLHKM